MAQHVRHPEILELARSAGRVTVEGLAVHFGVTPQTVRRDLAELAAAGLLERVHGGAVPRTGLANIGYEARRQMNAPAKAAIGAACAADIPEGASVFLDIGTTTEAVARALLAHRALMVLTNNLNVANILAENPGCEVVVTGGVLRRTDGGLVGTLASRTIAEFKVDIAVVGCSALDLAGDFLDFDLSEVGVSQSVLSHARRRVLVADAAKLGRQAPVRIASLAEIDAIYTDAPLPAPLARACAEWQTEVRLPA